MPAFRTRRVVAHEPAAMFDLVADVEKYPEFLPLCESLVVKSRQPVEGGGEVIVAALTVGYGLIRERFTSRVALHPTERRIDVAYLEGPFRKLDNVWHFEPHKTGCEVDFFIDYEFRSLAFQLLMGAMFDNAFRRFAEAFERRADAVYKGRGP
jgi:coenzyme Q-binding protein COQ10